MRDRQEADKPAVDHQLMKVIPSISVQILLAVLVTVFSVLGVYSIIEINRLKQRETRALQRTGTLTTDRIANSLDYPLWNLDRKETERMVLDEMSSSYVFRIQVLDEKGDLYIGKIRGRDGAVRNIEATDAGAAPVPPAALYSYQRPISHSDEAIGKVTVDITDANLLVQRRDLRWALAIKLLLLAAALSVVLFVALRGLVIRPLSTLQAWVESIPLGHQARPRFKRSAEINLLGEAFGNMSVSLQNKNQELESERGRLQDLNRQMEAEIEERKRTEEALRALEKRFSIAFNSSPIPLTIATLDEGRFLAVNDRFLATTGFTGDEVIGRTAVELGIWKAAEERQRLLQRLAAEGSLHDVEVSMWSKSGEQLLFMVSIEVIELDSKACVLVGLIDITERKEAERRASELAYFLSKMREAVIVTDLDNRFIYWNEGAEHTFGWSAAEVTGKLAEELFPDGPMAELEAPRRSVFETGEWQGELANVDRSGRPFFTESSWTLVRNEAGEAKAVVSISTDITERKEAEDALRASEERFSRIFNLSPYRMGIIRLRDGVILEVNDCWVRDTGFTREEVVGRPVVELDMWLSERTRTLMRSVLEAGQPIRGVEVPLLTKAGEQRVVLGSVEPIEINGEPCFLWAANDITERKQAEEALRESEEIFRTLAETVSAGIYIYRDAKFVYANPAAERLSGYTQDELQTMALVDLIHPDFREAVMLRVAASERGEPVPSRYEDKILTKSGEERWMEVTAARTSFLGQPAVIVTTFDITERKRAEAALQASEKRFSVAFNSSPMPAGISTLEGGRFLAVNDQFVNLSGYSRDEVLGRSALELGLSRDTPNRARLVEILKREGRVRDFEGHLRSKDGRDLVMLFSIEKIEIEGQPCMLQAGIDITRRKQIEEALQASEKRFSIAFNANPLMATISLLDGGRFLAVNDAFIALTGYSREDAVGSTALELNLWTASDHRLGLMEQLDKQGRVRSFEAHLRMKNGEERVMLISVEQIELEGRTCLLHSGNDITERQRATKTLLESEQRFQLASRATQDVIYDWDFTSGFLWWSESITQGSLGYLPGQVRYELAWWEERVHTLDREVLFAKLDAAIAGHGQEWEAEYRFRCANGSYAHIYERGFIVRSLEGEPLRMVGSMMDITERKQAEEQLIASREQMRALSERLRRAKEEEGIRIARELHDELGSMLTGLKWDLEKMDRTLSTSDNGAAVTLARKRIGSMTGLIESTINTVRRISAELRPGMLDHLGLVAAIEWQTQQFQERTGIECSWSTDLETADLPRESETAVFRIFQEILTNVLRHSGATRILVELRRSNSHLDLVVKDNGRGISEIEKGNTHSLGLLGMKERALLVGGEVNIAGKTGGGTTVVVRVPL